MTRSPRSHRALAGASFALALSTGFSALADPVKRFGGSGFWLDPDKWAFAMGGAPTGHVPTVDEDVILDAALTLDLSANPDFDGPDSPVAKSLLVQGMGTVALTKAGLDVLGDIMVDGADLHVTDGASIGNSELFGDLLIDNGGSALIDLGGVVDRENLGLIPISGSELTLKGDGKLNLTGDATIGEGSKVHIDGEGRSIGARIVANLPESTGKLFVGDRIAGDSLLIEEHGMAFFAGAAEIEGDVSLKTAGGLFTESAIVRKGADVTVDGSLFFGGFGTTVGSKWTVGEGGLSILAGSGADVFVTDGAELDVAGDVNISGGGRGLEVASADPPAAMRVMGDLNVTTGASFAILEGNAVVEQDVSVTAGSFVVGGGAAALLDIGGTLTLDSSTFAVASSGISDMGVVAASAFDFRNGNLLGEGGFIGDFDNSGRLFVGSPADPTSEEFEVIGSYTQASDGELHLVLSGDSGVTSDSLEINIGPEGVATGPTLLGGRLILHVDDSLVLETGDFIDLVLSGTALTGVFDEILIGETGSVVGDPTPTMLGSPHRIKYIRSAGDGIGRVRLIATLPAPGTAAGVALGWALLARRRRRA